MRQEPWFQSLFVSPLSKEYVTGAATQNPAGLAYFALVGIGIVSFAVNSSGTRGWRTLTWLVFCVLSAANQRFIPFFAVVAGPIAALNFQDFTADRYGTALPDRDVGRGLALAGRALTLVVLVLLIAGTWPGRLHANADNPRYARRVDWSIEVEPSLRKTAEQLAAWREAGQLPGSSRGFATSADMANYWTWFGPAEKGFFDYRYPLFEGSTNDYVELRRWLEGRAGRQTNLPRGARQEPDWLRIMREKRIDHVVLIGSQCNDMVARMLQFPREWTLLYLDGRTTIFGWNDPALRAKSDRFATLKFDLSARAVRPEPRPGSRGGNAEVSPPGRRVGSLLAAPGAGHAGRRRGLHGRALFRGHQATMAGCAGGGRHLHEHRQLCRRGQLGDGAGGAGRSPGPVRAAGVCLVSV